MSASGVFKHALCSFDNLTTNNVTWAEGTRLLLNAQDCRGPVNGEDQPPLLLVLPGDRDPDDGDGRSHADIAEL